MANDNITDAELEILRLLWRAGAPQSLTELRAALLASRGWEASTVKTLLYRLRGKGAVAEMGRGMYRAVAREDEVAQSAAREVIRKLYGGSAKNLVAALLGGGEFTDAELAELRALLNAGEARA
jgi:BlaI family penicillinase repressor